MTTADEWWQVAFGAHYQTVYQHRSDEDAQAGGRRCAVHVGIRWSGTDTRRLLWEWSAPCRDATSGHVGDGL